MNTNWKDVFTYLQSKQITIVEQTAYDTYGNGTHKYLKTPKGYINLEKNEYTKLPVFGTADLSINGYCFRADSVLDVIAKVEKFFAVVEMTTFEDFGIAIDMLKETK